MTSLVNPITGGSNSQLKTFGGVAAVILVAGFAVTEMSKPFVPVMASKRLSLVGNGLVITFSNQTSNQLSVTMRVTGKTRPKSFERIITIPPNGTSEFGWAEGWEFQYGDKVTLEHPNYRTYTWYIYEDAE